MPMGPLTEALIREALVAEQLKYEIDRDGDVHLIMSRRKGKDLDVYIFLGPARTGVLSIACYVYRWFSPNELPKLLLICNQWNRSHRIPKAFVAEPDSDGEYSVRLNHTVFCDGSASRELIRENLSVFLSASVRFWDELDEEL